MEWIKEILILFGRIITILPLLLVITLAMGKRSIGELPVFDFLIIITLGAVVGADIADPKIEHIHTAVAIVAIGLFQIIISKWLIKSRRFGRWITFEPTLVIQDGKFLVKNIKHIRYSLDNILRMLRENDVFDVKEVKLAIVEANGGLSIHRQPSKSPVSIEDLGITKKNKGLGFPLIVEGELYKDVLEQFKVDREWLMKQLDELGITDLKQVFFASINEEQELHVSPRKRTQKPLPPIHH